MRLRSLLARSLAVVLCLLCLGVGGTSTAMAPRPRAAVADSGTVVFIRSNNVWIARPDGSGARAVTSDGTASVPYSYPSEDDNGRIAVSHGPDTLVLMDQQGRVLRQWHATNDFPSISPDGRVIAFSYLTRVGQVQARFAHVLRYLDTSSADGAGRDLANSSQVDALYASWPSNSRTVVTGYTQPTRVDYQDVWTSGVRPWFQDCDNAFRPCPSAPLTDSQHWMSTVSRNGNRFASVVTLGGPQADTTVPTILDFESSPGALTGAPPAEPVHACDVPGVATVDNPGMGQVSIQTPSWSADGSFLVTAFRSEAGAWQVWRIDVPADLNDCASYGGEAILDNATQPRWSPAQLTPRFVRARTHTRLKLSTHRVRRNKWVRLTAIISGTNSGVVRFKDGRHTIRKVRVVRHRAQLRFRTRRTGRHTLRAYLIPTRSHFGSTSRKQILRVHR